MDVPQILNTPQSVPTRFAPGAAGFAGGFAKGRIMVLAKGKKISMPLAALALMAALLAGCAGLPGKSGHSSGTAGNSLSGSGPVSDAGTSNLSSSSALASTPSEPSVTSGSPQVSAAASSSGSASETVPKAMQQALKMTDKQWEDMLGGMDLCVAGYDTKTHESLGITFSKSSDISSEMLFTFFCYITEGASGFPYPKDYNMKWYDKAGKCRLPLSTVEAVLKQYFGNVSFSPSQISGYDSKTQTFTKMIDGLGGANAPVVTKKEQLSNNTLRITIDYYDVSAYYNTPSKKILLNIKAYTMRYSDDGFQFVSIVKE